MNNGKSANMANGGGHINTAFVMLPTQLLADVAAKKISEAAYTLYGFVKFWEGKNEHLWYGIPAMAERTGFSQSKVKRLIKELLDAGHISRQKKMGANWHTRCLTHVGKDGTVLVAGEPVNQQTNSQKSSASATVEKASNGTGGFTETEQEPREREARDAWKEKITWTEEDKELFQSYIKAKQLFLQEVSKENPELEKLYKNEFPNAGEHEMEEPLF